MKWATELRYWNLTRTVMRISVLIICLWMVSTAMEMVFMFRREVAFILIFFFIYMEAMIFFFQVRVGRFCIGAPFRSNPCWFVQLFWLGSVFWHGFKCIRVVLDSGLLYGSAYLYFGLQYNGTQVFCLRCSSFGCKIGVTKTPKTEI